MAQKCTFCAVFLAVLQLPTFRPGPRCANIQWSPNPVQLVGMGLITLPQEPIPLSEQHLGAQMLLAL